MLKLDFTLLNVGYAHHNADWNWRDIQSPFVRIHYVKRGRAKIIREDGVHEIRENHLYLTPSYLKHSYQCDGELELYYIHLYQEQGQTISLFDLMELPVEVEAESYDNMLIERLIQINPERELQFYDPTSYDNSTSIAYNIEQQQNCHIAFKMETQGIVKQLISRFMLHGVNKTRHIEERIFKSLRYIHQNIDSPIEITHLSEQCFLTKDHYIRLFKREMKCTPVTYINRKRIETAQLRIMIDGANIKDIAYGLGFDNISYFNRLFKKIAGESPGKYKKRIGSWGE